MLHHDTTIPLTDIPRILRGDGLEVKYHFCWKAATEGRIPAFRIGGRWFVDTANLARIAETFTPAEG